MARSRGLRLARAQAAEVRAAGGIPVPFSDLLAPEFYKAPDVLFSHDMFHPSAAGYSLAAKQLLPALCNALGEFITGMPLRSRSLALESSRSADRRLAAVARLGGVEPVVAALDGGARADCCARGLGSLPVSHY